MEKEIRLKEKRETETQPGNRGRLIVILAISGVLVVSLVAFTRMRQQASVAVNASGHPAAAVTPEPPIEVTSVPAITRGLQRGVELVGSLAADEEVVVAAQAPGELYQLNVDFGSFVSEGQVIATIDQRDAKLKVDQAEATLKQTMARLGMKEGAKYDPLQNADVRVAKATLDWSKMDLDRATKLVENGDVARSVYDQAMINHSSAEARYQAALDSVNQQLALVDQQRAALALAKKSITDTVVRAPISGAVKEKHASRGSYLPLNGRIVTLVKINPLRLRTDVPEYAAATVRTGQTVTLTVEALPGRTFSGRVVRIGPSLNEQTRALTVEAEVNNSGNLLRPGMFAKSQLITARDAPAVMVPQRAVVVSAGLSKIFVIRDGKVVERIVKTGLMDGDLIEIVEGLKEGEVVATGNLDKLQTGSLVNSSR